MRVDDEGMELPQRGLAATRLVYITPGHQFPLGITMSLRGVWSCWNGREIPAR